MSYNLNKAFWIIKHFAEEVGYRVEELSDTHLQVHLGKYHAVDFDITSNSSGYIQCNQWDASVDEYGQAVYSIRSVTDVISFCNILEASAKIRAKR